MPKKAKKPAVVAVTATATAVPVAAAEEQPTTVSPRSDLESLIGLDLGGSLSKVCFFVPDDSTNDETVKFAQYVASSESYGRTGVRDTKLSFASPRLHGRFHFIRFETSRTEGAIRLIKLSGAFKQGSVHVVRATGGGALKYKNLFMDQLQVKLEPEDELETVVRGIVFTLMECPTTCYTLEAEADSPDSGPKSSMTKIPRPLKLDELFPLLVVNIGSGVSIIKVESPSSMRRVSGTAVGGGTYFGLCKLLTRCETFDEAMDMAERGDSRRVNMLVSDIYGGGYDKVGLPGTLTASFFGKAASAHGASRPASSGSHEDVLAARRERLQPWWVRLLKATLPAHAPVAAALAVGCTMYSSMLGVALVLVLVGGGLCIAVAAFLRRRALANAHAMKKATLERTQSFPEEAVFRDEDIARALVTMVAQNVTQIAFMNAKLHGTKRIVFTGNFLRHNAIALRTLTTQLKLWSGGEVEAIFMEHEGFFGAIGAFLSSYNVNEPPKEEAARRGSIAAPQDGDDVYHLSPRTMQRQSKSQTILDEMADLRLT